MDLRAPEAGGAAFADAELEALLGGDRAAFARLVAATSTRLVRLSARLLGSRADAEDVVQDAYVKAYRALLAGEFDRRAAVETWLHRIVLNATIDASRRRNTRGRTHRDAPPPPETAGDDVEAHVALQELAAWLDDLPEDQRVALILKSVEGWSSSEIAEALRCSEGAVEQRLVRARNTLRERRDGR